MTFLHVFIMLVLGLIAYHLAFHEFKYDSPPPSRNPLTSEQALMAVKFAEFRREIETALSTIPSHIRRKLEDILDRSDIWSSDDDETACHIALGALFAQIIMDMNNDDDDEEEEKEDDGDERPSISSGIELEDDDYDDSEFELAGLEDGDDFGTDTSVLMFDDDDDDENGLDGNQSRVLNELGISMSADDAGISLEDITGPEHSSTVKSEINDSDQAEA